MGEVAFHRPRVGSCSDRNLEPLAIVSLLHNPLIFCNGCSGGVHGHPYPSFPVSSVALALCRAGFGWQVGDRDLKGQKRLTASSAGIPAKLASGILSEGSSQGI